MRGSDPGLYRRLVDLLKEHNRLFLVALFAYGLIVFPYLNVNGYQTLGSVIGILFLALMFVATRANFERAMDKLKDDDDEHRGF
ncbi:hypothetical protein [Haloarchaeobius sp. HME9146]|uniref:hypothetical protein n=1 Tax=Haloarchaeobius sp. HME9146 TaxID=2978732 RepID=UPI0021BEC0B9|nr:hypothetical protein [Haloarchaeobius sp. HME9146]MCT9096483.1 hypothetical protein [Haloarchaeobius sp. HME9146]